MVRKMVSSFGSKFSVALLLSGAVAAVQVGCAAPPADADASEGAAALSDTASESGAVSLTASLSPSGELLLQDEAGQSFNAGAVDTSAFDTRVDENGDVIATFRDGSSVRASDATALGGSKRLRLEWSDGRVVYVATSGSSPTAPSQPGPIGPRAVPIIVGGIAVAVLIGGTAYYFTVEACNKAYQKTRQDCIDLGLVPTGGGCTVRYLIYYHMTPAECKPKGTAMTTVRTDRVSL